MAEIRRGGVMVAADPVQDPDPDLTKKRENLDLDPGQIEDQGAGVVEDVVEIVVVIAEVMIKGALSGWTNMDLLPVLNTG